mmetsp:Transcript_113680/g.178879  ORF Transcript_113680/g.178879 Transcript_113680/m.178879 type:complete len:98 (-) Transcript_113680:26-319(-)
MFSINAGKSFLDVGLHFQLPPTTGLRAIISTVGERELRAIEAPGLVAKSIVASSLTGFSLNTCASLLMRLPLAMQVEHASTKITLFIADDDKIQTTD